MKLERLLEDFADPETGAVKCLRGLVDWLRPAPWEGPQGVMDRMTGLEAVLEARPEVQAALSAKLREWTRGAHFLQLFTSVGINSRRGFLRELVDRVYERINPSPADLVNVRDAFFVVFRRRTDAEWVIQVPDEHWQRFLQALWRLDETDWQGLRQELQAEVLYALELLSIWVAGEELEPDILRLDPGLVERDSAFLALQRELAVYAREYPRWVQGEREDLHDDAHARVLLEQCVAEVARLRRRTISRGTSVALTHMLERLDQSLHRIEELLDLLDPARQVPLSSQASQFFKKVVTRTASRHSLRALWSQNSRLLARSITENASQTGEHYIAGSRREWLQMLASAAGGGFVIAFMALIKIQILAWHLAPLPQTILVSLNYGLGFVLIHMMHCTVATKQPAMTAASIAERVEQDERGRANPRRMAELLNKVLRTQFVAILGNVSVAVTLALGVGALFRWRTGTPIVDAEKYASILQALHPLESPALFYAAIAGVWLFCSGLIAGFFDNRAAYIGLRERLYGHPLLRRLLPRRWRAALADYLSANHGALISNFLFGCMLGTTGYVGHLLGLPIDIRHVAFSSADVGYAMSTGPLQPALLAQFLAFALLIGGVNLVVSFSLALNVALRARGVRIASPGRWFRAWVDELRAHPTALFFPPPAAPAETEGDQGGPSGTGRGGG